ncbi:Hypothetical predicted protein [Pelobates cultripes]|uniref:GIY-YIG domain-containing protein n=1 Tax=Pelobates cultripes TaxID=61616 RepID=A0AAD1T2A5_PELCU|nr:Hypothetical predicted protein [Pelobates cultripes]
MCNNSKDATREKQLLEMTDKFLERGYKRSTLDKALEEARNSRVPDGEETNNKAIQKLVFPTTHHQSTTLISSTIRKNWRILAADDTLPKVFHEKPLICYKRNKNLKDLLVHTDPTSSYMEHITTQNRGCVRCLGCVTCGHMMPSKTFSHPHTNKQYLIKKTITCKTTHVIYKLMCPCGLAYVGKTETALCERIRGHRSSIRLAYRDGSSDKPVAKHFWEYKHPLSALKFVAIDHIPLSNRAGDRGKILLNRETYWIYELDTVSPKGLNEHISFHSFL